MNSKFGGYIQSLDILFTDWAKHGICTLPCGGGIQHWVRNCVNSRGNTVVCDGNMSRQTSCNTHKCQEIVAEWTEWSTFGLCSVSCGEGVRTRYETFEPKKL